jgi:co-chaperonin GroES (HSP10)
MIQPLAKRIVVEPVFKEKKSDLIFLKDVDPYAFKVIAIGDEVTKVSINDLVIIEYPFHVKIEDIVYKIVTEDNVVAKITVV